jgi:hypothetical protein
VDIEAFEYVPAAGWDDRGPFAAVQSRDQCTVRVLGIDPAEGATRVLAEQRDKSWVQLVRGLPARAGDGSLIGHADLGGTRHLTVGPRNPYSARPRGSRRYLACGWRVQAGEAFACDATAGIGLDGRRADQIDPYEPAVPAAASRA